MIKKFKERNVHLVIIAFLLGTFFGMNFSLRAFAQESAHKYLDYFHTVYQLISREYVDKPVSKDMFYGAIRGMIKSLGDPYSRFLDEKSFEELREMTTGKFVGVGIEITQKNSSIVVITPIDDSPAMEAGIMAGDIIVKVNDTLLKDKKLSEVIKLIKGLPGSRVKMFIHREGMEDLLEFDIERKPIKIKSVKYTIIKNRKVGYLKILSFGSDTGHDVSKALKHFNKNNIDKVIVDLRYNPGGLLSAAIEISDYFLEKGTTIVSTKGREDLERERVFKATNNKMYTGKVLLLVNRGSASASEIVSGALRDNKRAFLLGEKTFGKGSVQKTYNLDKNIGVAITIAKYYTPSGKLIHKKGIKPDYPVEQSTFTKEEKKALLFIHNKKILDTFVTDKTRYDDATKKKFMELLKSKKLELSENSAHYILKSRILRYKKRALYDLEFDNQLVKAIAKINE